MSLEQELDHAGKAYDRLCSYLRDRPVLETLIRALVGPFQDAEDTLWALYTQRSIDTAVGEQLDVIGRILELSRFEADDDTYRVRLRARIRALKSSGTAEDVYAVFSLLLPDTALSLTTYFPASFTLDIGFAVDPQLVSLYVDFLHSIKSAGVKAILLWSESLSEDTFRFDSGPGFDQGHLAGAEEA